jgi:pyrroline-5-carboxylate reductase
MSITEKQLGFIGAGRMASALAKGFVDASLVESKQIVACDPDVAAAESFASSSGGRVLDGIAAVARAAEILFLAVKPQQMGGVLKELQPEVTAEHLIISIAAGTTLATISQGLSGRGRLVRVMPNTPCLVGESASGFSLGPGATAADEQLVESLLGAVGRGISLDEYHLDAVTGLSGSGPAFAFLMIEALSDGGVLEGLPRQVATLLAAQTLKGAAEMVLVTGEHPGVLKDRVASPGGTTIAGLQALEAAGLRAGLISAVEAATRRSRELAADAGDEKST